jgi:hypothetical protein
VIMDIPKLQPIYCSGHFSTLADCKYLERRLTGLNKIRVCIHLKRPQRRTISIEETQHQEEIENNIPYVISGTKKNNLTVYRRPIFPRPKPYSSVGFGNKLKMKQITPKRKRSNGIYWRLKAEEGDSDCDTYENTKYRFEKVDLKGIFTSNCQFDNSYDSPEESSPILRGLLNTTGHHRSDPIEINCVVQQRKQSGLIEQGFSDLKIEALNINSCEPDNVLCELIRTKLPMELYTDIIQYMNYDQVKCFVDENETLLRKLANKRYNIDSFDTKKFPDMSSLRSVIRRNAAHEMRFNRGEDLWLVPLGVSKNSGIAKRVAIMPGIYKWTAVSAITSMRYDCGRSVCKICTDKLTSLQRAMLVNQEQIVKGCPHLKIFLLEGSEDAAIDTRYTSPFYRGADVWDDHDYSVHMWVDDLDNRWIQDIQINDDDWLKEWEYKMVKDYKTMIFKDPVKFFGTSKYMDSIGDGVVALTCKLTGEVLGYIVEDEQFRFRTPSGQSVLEQPKITGLNFLSSGFYNEMREANQLVKHVRRHEVNANINAAEERLSDLEIQILDPDNDTVALQNDIDSTLAFIQCQKNIIDNGFVLNPKSCLYQNFNKNGLHFHEVYEEDFDFCVKYTFNKLGESNKKDNIEGNIGLLFTYCPYEMKHPERKSSLKIINQMDLLSIYVVREKNPDLSDVQ